MDPETQALGKPRGCPSGVYELMVDCLDMDPMRRPSFQVGVISTNDKVERMAEIRRIFVDGNSIKTRIFKIS